MDKNIDELLNIHSVLAKHSKTTDERVLSVRTSVALQKLSGMAEQIATLEESNRLLALDVAGMREALADLFASVTGGKKSCGHDFTCVCPGDKARKALTTDKGDVCNHQWVCADNVLVSGAEICLKCKTIRAAQGGTGSTNQY